MATFPAKAEYGVFDRENDMVCTWNIYNSACDNDCAGLSGSSL